MCPCFKCDCGWTPHDRSTVTLHLYQKGFQKEYYIWYRHGENYGQQGVTFDIGGAGPSSAHVDETDNVFQHDRDFVQGWFPQYSQYQEYHMPNEPNEEARNFYDLINTADQPLYEGHNMSLLHWITDVMRFKTSHPTTQAQIEDYIQGCRNMVLPQYQHSIPDSYYKMKKVMLKLGLGVIKYDVRKDYCCIYYNEHANLRSILPILL